MAAILGLIDRKAAADHLGVAPQTIKSWARRYAIPVLDFDEHGRALYSLAQLVTLERKLRNSKRGNPELRRTA